MKPLTPHDPFDELIAAALHGELSPEERAQFDLRLQTDPAAQAAYQKAKVMHDLLEKTHHEAQPDPAFEQRMVSGVRRKMESAKHRETSWESALALWKGVRTVLGMRYLWAYGGVCSVVLVLALGFVVYTGSQVKGVFTTITSQLAMAGSSGGEADAFADANEVRNGLRDMKKRLASENLHYSESAQNGVTLSGYVDTSHAQLSAGRAQIALTGAETYRGGTTITATTQGGTAHGSGFAMPELKPINAPTLAPPAVASAPTSTSLDYLFDHKAQEHTQAAASAAKVDQSLALEQATDATKTAVEKLQSDVLGAPLSPPSSDQEKTLLAQLRPGASSIAPAVSAPVPVDDRKLIRNAQLDLEVKSFQAAMDQITALTKSAGGYVDTSNSQKGGNGKLQGAVVVKVLPQNLDDFLLKLRDLGVVQNQSVSTDDVTKDYFDTQARLVNSQKMEAQLQDLLKRENGKVADLLAVERELGRVRGEIEGMQGQLKLYDFQVQYATVTMNLGEKDLNQAAAYLLKEQDDFALYATNVEDAFQKARAAADDFKAQVLTANLNHNSGTDVSAELMVMVAPEQIEPFLAQVRALGRVANFTRQTQRVAKDGGDSAQPADETKTEKDKVQVHVMIRSDDETRKQVALTVVAKAVDVALDAAKAAALANAGTEILNSALNTAPQGQSTAQLTVRVPGAEYAALIGAYKALGRTASLSIQRNDDSGPGANGDDAPVIVSLALTDDDAPLQQTDMTVGASDVDAQSKQIKKAASDSGVEVKASSFSRQPDGSELAQMTFRLTMAKYPAFLESVKALGKVESLTVQRNDRPDETRTDDNAPAEIDLQLHNQRDIIADDAGFWATMRQTFGEGAGALLTSVRVIGVMVAFTLPWVVTLVVMAWAGRRIYVWRKR